MTCPHTLTHIAPVRWLCEFLFFAAVRRRLRCKPVTVCQRKTDGTLWVAAHPQSAAYAMRGLFSGKSGFHFHRARIWRGVLVVSPRIFWMPLITEFKAIQKQSAMVFNPWPVETECRKIDERLAS